MSSEIVDCPHCGNNVSHEIIELYPWKIISCAKHPKEAPPLFVNPLSQRVAQQFDNERMGFLRGYDKPKENI